MHGAQFPQMIRKWYHKEGRTNLPWRIPALTLRKDGTVDPYKILVSEIMLQQTQVDRVIPKYSAFIRKFPSLHVLAKAPLSEVLREWQGLGYNRRGKLLWECAKVVVTEHKGKLPRTQSELMALPGIGPYIAGAVAAFAYNQPVVFIETNIRTVYTHHFFPHKEKVTDGELAPVIERTLDRKHPREWYSALMDYGSYLKRSGVRINARNPLYKKQPKFAGSNRQIRGAILRSLSKGKSISSIEFLENLGIFDHERIALQLSNLEKEGLITAKQGKWMLPS